MVMLGKAENKMVLVAVKLSLTPRIGFGENEEFNMPANTPITITLRSDAAVEEIEAKGITIQNNYSISLADITILCVGRDADALKSSSGWLDRRA